MTPSEFSHEFGLPPSSNIKPPHICLLKVCHWTPLPLCKMGFLWNRQWSGWIYMITFPPRKSFHSLVPLPYGMFGIALTVAKTALSVAPQLKQILRRSWNLFEKISGKIDSPICKELMRDVKCPVCPYLYGFYEWINYMCNIKLYNIS
jgi:hypothetical protein